MMNMSYLIVTSLARSVRSIWALRQRLHVMLHRLKSCWDEAWIVRSNLAKSLCRLTLSTVNKYKALLSSRLSSWTSSLIDSPRTSSLLSRVNKAGLRYTCLTTTIILFVHCFASEFFLGWALLGGMGL